MKLKSRHPRRPKTDAIPVLWRTGMLLGLLGGTVSTRLFAQGVSDWSAPVGIPMPSFGIKEDAKSLYGAGSGATFDYEDDGAAGPVTYRLTSGGDPYTHYIDPSRSDATDQDNPNGTADRPRRTLPSANLGGGKLSSGTAVTRIRLKPGSVVHIANTMDGVPWSFGFTSGWNGKDVTNDSIGIGTAEKPIFIRGVDPVAPCRILLLLNGQEMPNTEYMIFENLYFDGGNHTIKWPYSYGGTFPPTDPYQKPDVNPHQNLEVTSGSNCVAFRKCKFAGAKWYDHRYQGVRGHGLSIKHSNGGVGPLGNVVIYHCTVGPNGTGADINDPTINVAPSWKGIFPPEYVNKTYPWREECNLIGLNIGNGTKNIWVLESELFANGDAIQCGEISTKPGLKYPPERIFIGRNNFHDDQENNVDIKGGLYCVMSENSFSGVHRGRNTSDGLPYKVGVNTLIKGGGGGEAVRINDEGINGYVWILNNVFKNCTHGLTRGKNGFIYEDTSTWGSMYVIGNVFQGMDRDPVFYPLFHGNQTDGPKGEAQPGDGWAYYGVATGELWFVNNTIDSCARGIQNYNSGDMHFFNNIISNRLYSTDPDGIERAYLDVVWWNKAGELPPGGYRNTLDPNIIFPFYKGNTPLVQPRIADPKYLSSDNKAGDGLNYRPAAGSPAINAGIDPSKTLGALFLQQFGYDLKFTDRAGTPRGSGGAWDIGAYEYNGTSPDGNPAPDGTSPDGNPAPDGASPGGKPAPVTGLRKVAK